MATPAAARPASAVKRACDGCKIRKIKCSETPPCNGCLAVNIPCTFNKHQGIRGPRKLRTKTMKDIVLAQRREEDADAAGMSGRMSPSGVERVFGAFDGEGMVGNEEKSDRGENVVVGQRTLPPLVASPASATSPPTSTSQASTTSPTPIATLVLQLCVYRLRMFPVWPIVAVEDVMAALQKDPRSPSIYALANAVGAATIAQLKSKPLKNGAETVTRESMEGEVQRTRAANSMKLDLDTLRTSFFLHVYHENLEAGGMKSLLYLREALTMAQLMDLHKEESYTHLPAEEQQFRRRVFWLLFVTERGVAVLHKLPVVLKANIAFPVMEYDEEVSILPAFRKLVNLFWIFEQSDAFTLIQNSNPASDISPNQSVLNILQQKLQELPVDAGASNDVQTADICVTRAWMRAFLWKIMMGRGSLSSASSAQETGSVMYPLQIAREFLDVMSDLPASAIEAHGTAMEFKVYEITTCVLDSLSRNPLVPPNEQSISILTQLQQILISCRGESDLVSQLEIRIENLRFQGLSPNHRIASNSPHNSNNNNQRTTEEDLYRGNENLSDAARSHNNMTLDYQQPQTQQYLSFPWDAIAEENLVASGMGGGGGGYFNDAGLDPSGRGGNNGGSAVLDRFLGDAMTDISMSTRSDPSPGSSWM